MLIAVLIFAAALAVLVLWAAGGLQSPHTFEEPPLVVSGVAPRTNEGAPGAKTSTITVVTWNIAWGYGWGSEGSGQARAAEHFDRTVPRIGEVLRALGADVVLLQEIDFDSTRSHRANQATAIAKAAGLPYVARAPSWTANWVPFPYWPPAEQFGHMSSGGAVLSRFPILKNRVELLAKPGANAWWYNLFYLFRYFQRAEVDVEGTKIQVYNTHLEAFNSANRLEQAEHLKLALQLEMTPLTIFGGDFNTTPPEARLRGKFPDEPNTDHEGDNTLNILRTVRGLFDTIHPDQYRAAESDWFTFPAHAANRKLDYLFAGAGFEVVEARVAKEAGDVSDHLPIVVKLVVKAK